jgi:hypothetical protein
VRYVATRARAPPRLPGRAAALRRGKRAADEAEEAFSSGASSSLSAFHAGPDKPSEFWRKQNFPGAHLSVGLFLLQWSQLPRDAGCPAFISSEFLELLTI